MKHLRNTMVGLLFTGLIMSAVPSLTHAFSSQQVNSSTASVTVGGGVAQMSAPVILTVASNAPATTITWTGATAGGGWQVADDYLLLNATITISGHGIQTYTDNMAADASPAFTGDKTVTTPAGLIDTTDTTQKLPTAWSIRHATGTVASVDPNAQSGDSFLWFFHEDKSQVAIPSANAAAFANGDPYITAEQAGSPNPQIHFAQGPTQFGEPTGNPALAGSQNAMYIETNFGSALSGRTYKTSTVRVELFTQ
jgi:hypothetical protein